MAELQAQGIAKVGRAHKKRPLSSDMLREAYDRSRSKTGGWSGEQAILAKHFIAEYPLSPSDLLERMLDDCADEADILASLAAHPRTSPAHLARLLERPEASVRAAAARNPQISPRQLGELASDASEDVALAAAAHPQLKARHQALLATSRFPSVRAALVRHPKLEAEIATALTADPSPVVRFALASQASVDDDLLQLWADSDLPELQFGLLARKALPDAVLHSLLLSTHGEVRRAVAAQCELELPYLVLLIEQGDGADHAYLAEREDLPPKLYETLAAISAPETLHRLARNRALPAELAMRFLQLDEGLRLAMLDNPIYRPHAIEALRISDDDAEQGLLAYLPEVDEAQLADLVNGELSAGAVAHLAVQNRHLPGLRADLAYALSQHPLPSLRAFALRSFPFPVGTLGQLARDPSQAVAKLAKQRLANRPAKAHEDEGSVFAEGRGMDAWAERLNAYVGWTTTGSSQ